MEEVIFETEKKGRKKVNGLTGMYVTLLLLRTIQKHFSLPMPGLDVTQIQPSARKINFILNFWYIKVFKLWFELNNFIQQGVL